MSTFVVLGDAKAAPKLVTATLNDYLDLHLDETPDDDLVFIIATRYPIKPAIKHVIDWCDKAGVYYEVVASSDKIIAADDAVFKVSANFMIEAVEDGYAYGGASTTVLALVGEEDPTVDVTRAIARAVDSHMVVRDLSEGALTYIKFYGDAVDEPQEENNMAAEAEVEMTLPELIALADEGDEEAIEALTEVCGEVEIDPAEYATWAELEPIIAEALGLEEAEEEEVVEEEEEEEVIAEPTGGWTADDLKGKQLKEVREIAGAAGIENYKTAPRPQLVKALIDGTSGVAEEPAAPAKKAAAKSVPAKTKGDASAGGPDWDLIAEKMVDVMLDRIISRLS